MITRTRHVVVARSLGLASWALLVLLCAGAPAEAAPSPSAYRVSAVCPAPAPGVASCLALRLAARAPLSIPGARALPRTSHPTRQSAAPAFEQTTPIPESLSPDALLAAYDLPTSSAAAGTQTIALVDAYDDETVEADLQHYDQQFDLPECTEADGCFRKVDQAGKSSPLPEHEGKEERRWAQEIATDVETAHGVCRSCHILLVEADSPEYTDLEQAEQAAVALGATEISNSWGGPEPTLDSQAFNHPGVVITASAGDDGYRNWTAEPEEQFTSYPASSPHVIAVGGTRLLLNQPADNTWLGEEVWNDGAEEGGFKAGAGAGGGGCSELFPAPAWQRSLANWTAVGCGEKRAVADVSADADPYTGVAVYDSTESQGSKGWGMIGGTSVASPIIAAVFALAGGAHEAAYPARTLYENVAKSVGSLHDVTAGSNGECLKPLAFESETEPPRSGCTATEEAERSCLGEAICLAGTGYDGPSGLGTPDGLEAFEPTEPAVENSHIEERVSSSSQPSQAPPSEPSRVVAAAPLAEPAAVALSHLALTFGALIALNHSHPRISQVDFAFDISAAARVRVTLAKKVRSHRHMRWKTLSGSLMLTAVPGHNSHRLSGRRVMSAGYYRLTLAPSGGAARSLVFQIG
jgi:Subtilase family